MSNTNTFVGSKIKGLRETKNLSVEEVAESTGLSVEQINSIENDQNLPSLGPLIKIARALGVRLGTFMDDNDALGPVVTRAADRERENSISFSNGATDARKHMEYHPLAQQKAGRHMEPFIIDINPETTPEYKLSAHEGEEWRQHLLRFYREAPSAWRPWQICKNSCTHLYPLLSYEQREIRYGRQTAARQNLSC